MYILILLVALLPFLLEIFNQQVGLRDSMGITVGMSMEEYRGQFEEDELFEFHQYGCFVNNIGYPVIICHNKTAVTEIHVIDLAKIDRSTAGFEKLEAGMSLVQVGQIVGVPAASEAGNDSVLFYLCKDGQTYMLTYNDTGAELVLEKVEVVKPEEG